MLLALGRELHNPPLIGASVAQNGFVAENTTYWCNTLQLDLI